MWFCLFRVLLITVCLPFSFQADWPFKKDPKKEWDRIKKRNDETLGAMPKRFRYNPGSNVLRLPDFVKVSSTVDQKALFEPEVGSRLLPNSVLSILFPATTIAPPEPDEPIIEVLCHIDRMYVRIRSDIFHTSEPYKFLKLGNCVPNQGTEEHYYFFYLLITDCGSEVENTVDSLIIKNSINFWPTTPILRDLPFDIPLQCQYHRYIHSYKGAIRPKLQGGILYKRLRIDRPFQLIPQDALGNEKTTPYNMGDIMYFEVEEAGSSTLSATERVYINKCIITSSLVPSSLETAIIDNYGCMVDGKVSEDSKFLHGPSMNSQRFSIPAGVLSRMLPLTLSTVQLYMYCDVSVGPNTPSDGLKACNHNIVANTWSELYGDVSVCSCCASTCPPPVQSRVSRSKVISQKVKLNYEEYDLMTKN